MDTPPHTVSTEPQRLALEAMSAQLVQKLNAMIAEQEARTRVFAEQHKSSIAIPAEQKLLQQSELPPARKQDIPPSPFTHAKQAPPDSDRWSDEEAPITSAAAPPLHLGFQQQTVRQEEKSDIGIGMIIFSLIGIVILLRSCS